MKPIDGENTFYAKNSEEWREWLVENHLIKESIWLIIYKKKSGIPSIYYSEAVDEALCFGWIDSLPNKRDDKSYYQYFSKRKLRSNWSRVNKLKVAKLLKENKIEPQGLKMITYAKENGTWDALNEVDSLLIPKDLSQCFEVNPVAKSNFERFPPSTKQGILQWILNAKQAATRLKRIIETVELAEQNIRANQYQPKE